ncbi:MAG: hypothetical protein EYC70_09835 [Planctomycetota bacterium]|nr:MAG: hypothetical protein EYC70_09835 [Planctomycetota bacterium]
MSSSPRESILQGAARLRRRSARMHWFRYGLRALFYGLFGAAILAWMAPEVPLWALAAGTLSFGAAVGAWCAWRRKPALLEAAKAGDDRVGDKDRLSSAVQLLGEDSPMVRALLADAAAGSHRVDPSEVYPMHVPREGWLLPLPLLACALALVLPGMLRADPRPNPELAAMAADQAAVLREFVARERQKEQTPRRKELLDQLERLAQELSREGLMKKDALSEIAKAMADLQRKRDEEQRKLEMEQLIKSFQQNDRTRELAQEVNSGNYQDAANKVSELIEELKKEIQRKKAEGADPKLLEELEQKLRELEELKAKLLNLLNVNYDIGVMGEVLDFLGQVEGDLAALPDEEVVDLRYLKLNPG